MLSAEQSLHGSSEIFMIMCTTTSPEELVNWFMFSSFQEVRLMKLVQHPNVVRLYEVSENV